MKIYSIKVTSRFSATNMKVYWQISDERATVTAYRKSVMVPSNLSKILQVFFFYFNNFFFNKYLR